MRNILRKIKRTDPVPYRQKPDKKLRKPRDATEQFFYNLDKKQELKKKAGQSGGVRVPYIFYPVDPRRPEPINDQIKFDPKEKMKEFEAVKHHVKN